MQAEDKNVIRYLMKEMDPSEEVLMERAMMKDDDLLIEVESMRQTMGRLDDLPEKQPPTHLSEAIIKQAADHKEATFAMPTIPTDVFKYAAVLLIGVGIGGGIWMITDNPSIATSQTQQAQQQANTSDATNAGIFSTTSTTDETNTAVEPWVDHGNTLYFQDMAFDSESSEYKAILKSSMDRLQPVDEQAAPMTMQGNRDVHLTSTPVNN